MEINHNNFGINKLHGNQAPARQAHVAKEETQDFDHQVTDSTVSLTGSFKELHQEAHHHVAHEHREEAVANVAARHEVARPSFSNSPLKMGELGEVNGVDLNGPDRLHEAKIDGLNGIYSTKLVGLSGRTLANLNPLGH